MNKDVALHSIKSHNLIGIKAGLQRTSFLEIWMVVVNDRIFARSWGLAEKSWYNTFLLNPAGQLKCGGDIFSVRAVIPADREELTAEINKAYLTKYNSGSNIKYATAIIGEKHTGKTMEFILCE